MSFRSLAHIIYKTIIFSNDDEFDEDKVLKGFEYVSDYITPYYISVMSQSLLLFYSAK